MVLKFKEGSKVVYPSHGVGIINGIETNEVVGMVIKTYVIQFDKEKMVLRIPVGRAEKSGLRPLSTTSELDKVGKILLERPKTSRGMWSRRAKEYESKINSGNIVFVAEVVRDLHKNVDDPERSYSERIIYENALERLASEVSAIKKIDIEGAQNYLVNNLNTKNPYFVRKAALAAAKKAEEDALEAGESDEYEDDEAMAA
ncbi:MAG TPA: CarD family transcriptional regulator [Alphaproteobacteria bacterium]|nr:CarD family transcriptional regulator [Alphaproteobacteria bacterium]